MLNARGPGYLSSYDGKMNESGVDSATVDENVKSTVSFHFSEDLKNASNFCKCIELNI